MEEDTEDKGGPDEGQQIKRSSRSVGFAMSTLKSSAGPF